MFWLYPPLMGVGWLLARRSVGRARAVGVAPPVGPAWATAGVVVLAIVLMAFGAFASNPLPRSVPGVVLYDDLVFGISLAAEALHHWPVTNPNVSGSSLRYHLFAFLDVAATAQVTGISIDVIVLRLQPVVFVLVIGLQMAWLASKATLGARWVAPGAVAILLLAGELDLDSVRNAPFAGLFPGDLFLSPTFAFGLVFFIAAVGTLLGVLRDPEPVGRGTWVLLGLLLIGAMGAKATTLPVALLALGLFTLWRRRLDRRVVVAGCIAAAAFVGVFLALFSGGGEAGAVVKPFTYLDYTALSTTFSRPVLSFVGGVAATVAMVAPWLGALLLVGRVRDGERTAVAWLACVTLASVVPFVALSQPGFSQVYFIHYGVPAAAVLSAWGVVRAWPSLRSGRRVWVGGLVVAGAALGVALRLRDDMPIEAPLTAVGYLAPYAVLALILVVVGLVLERRLAGVVAFVVCATVVLTLVDTPLDTLQPWADKRDAGVPQYVPDQPAGPRGVTTGSLAALRWLRGVSDPDDVVAVNVDSVSGSDTGRFFGFAAFAERRTFLGGFGYTSEAVAHAAEERPGLPFARRRALNTAAFAGNVRALRTLRDSFGVRYLVADVGHGQLAPALGKRLPEIYRSDALRIYRLGKITPG